MKTVQMTTIEELFQKWLSNKNIKLSFATYVQTFINQGVVVRDIDRYKNLLRGGNKHGHNF